MPESTTSSSRPRVLSGMRPTGKLHLGNYMGALANWVKLQDQYECYFFIADLHALTTDYADPSRLKLNTLDVALDWLAAGLDPAKSTIFIQSHVPQHAELHLLFSMITPLGWLERVPSYKEQQENLTGKDLTTYGFLGYPLLQAADILLYQAQFVPVGQDQVAHVELTREVARRFNSMYKSRSISGAPVFREPEALLTPSPKLPGTDGRKMSKSYGNTIGLTEDPKSIEQKIETMSTNGQRPRQSDIGNPDLCPVGDLHKVFSPLNVITEIQAGCRTASIGCKDCKALAAKSVLSLVKPIHARREDLKTKQEDVWNRLREDSHKASITAEKVLDEARAFVGLSRDYDSVYMSTGTGFTGFRCGNIPHEIRMGWLAEPELRDFPLKEEAPHKFASIERFLEEPLITASKKRVLVIAADPLSAETRFEIAAKSYEIWVLLILNLNDGTITDFVLPQKVFSQSFSQAKRSLKNGEKIHLIVRKDGDRYLLSIHGSEPIDISDLLGDYDPLR